MMHTDVRIRKDRVMTHLHPASIRRCAALCLVTIAVASWSACGSTNNSKPAAAPATRGPIATLATTGTVAPNAAVQAVDIQNTSFPATINVKPGTTVTWTNRDDFQHTV